MIATIFERGPWHNRSNRIGTAFLFWIAVDIRLVPVVIRPVLPEKFERATDVSSEPGGMEVSRREWKQSRPGLARCHRTATHHQRRSVGQFEAERQVVHGQVLNRSSPPM